MGPADRRLQETTSCALRETSYPGRALAFVSSVSGGSVGALQFLDGYRPDGPPAGRETLDRIVQAAGRSSLDEIAWGMAYPDLLRTVAPFLLRHKERDRGWALERAWEGRLAGGSGGQLGAWSDSIASGWRPLVVFNATLVETGQRLLFSPLDLPESWGRSFYKLYPDDDTDLVSAVRLSAAFPFVSPQPRLMRPRQAEYHVADGGYYDNYGVVTALHYLDDLIPAYRERGGKRALLLQIRSSPDPDEPTAMRRRGWAFEAVGPLLALLSVRTGAQRFHNDFEVEQMAAHLRLDGFELLPVVLEFDEEGATSWKLTAFERCRIEAKWRGAALDDEIAAVRSFLGLPPGRPSSPEVTCRPRMSQAPALP